MLIGSKDRRVVSGRGRPARRRRAGSGPRDRARATPARRRPRRAGRRAGREGCRRPSRSRRSAALAAGSDAQDARHRPDAVAVPERDRVGGPGGGLVEQEREHVGPKVGHVARHHEGDPAHAPRAGRPRRRRAGPRPAARPARRGPPRRPGGTAGHRRARGRARRRCTPRPRRTSAWCRRGLPRNGSASLSRPNRLERPPARTIPVASVRPVPPAAVAGRRRTRSPPAAPPRGSGRTRTRTAP